MRKETLINYKINHSHANNLGEVISKSLREKGWRDDKGFHPQGKVNQTQKRGNEVILLKDSRMEWEAMEHTQSETHRRVFFTTSFLVNEILQTNRGNQNYEYNKDKFFTQDTVSNSSTMGGEGMIPLLDLMWYMVQNKLDAVIIPAEQSKEMWTPYSARYKTQVAPKNKLRAKIMSAIDTISKFTLPVDNDEYSLLYTEEHREYEGDEEMTPMEYNLIHTIRQRFCSHVRYNLKDLTTYDYKELKKFVEENLKENSFFLEKSPRNVIKYLAQDYGFMPNDLAYNALDYFCGRERNYQYNLIAESKWKRPQPYRLDNMNTIKAELLAWRNKNEK